MTSINILYTSILIFTIFCFSCTEPPQPEHSNQNITSITENLERDKEIINSFISSQPKDLGEIISTYKSVYVQGVSLTNLMRTYRMCGEKCSESFALANKELDKVKEQLSIFDSYAASIGKEVNHYCCSTAHENSFHDCEQVGGPPFTMCPNFRVICNGGEMTNPDGSISCNDPQVSPEGIN